MTCDAKTLAQAILVGDAAMLGRIIAENAARSARYCDQDQNDETRKIARTFHWCSPTKANESPKTYARADPTASGIVGPGVTHR
jgi:hypothetical protein